MFVVKTADFVVNEVQIDSQVRGEVAALTNGNYAVVWVDPTGAIVPRIRVRILDNDGRPILGDPIEHEITVTSSADPTGGARASIAPLEGGGFIVAWTEFIPVDDIRGMRTEVRAQAYDASGNVAGDLVRLTGYEGANARNPMLSVSHTSIVMVYSTFAHEPDNLYRETVPVIISQMIGPGGSIGTSNEIARGEIFLMPGGQLVQQGVGEAVVAEFGTGHIIAWSAQKNYNSVTGKSDTVYYVQGFTGFGPISQPVLVPFRVTDIAAKTIGSISDFIVIGLAQTEQTDGQDVVGQMFNGSSGKPSGDPFIVNTTTEGNQHAPSVTPLGGAAGGFVVVWADEPNGAVGAQVFDWLGQRREQEFPVTFEAGGSELSPWNYSNPSIAADIYGGFMVTWTGFDDNGYGVLGQTYTPALAISYGPFGSDSQVIDFNNLTNDQIVKIDEALFSSRIFSIYDALGGNDNITLPNIEEAQITSNVIWNFNLTFDAGIGHDLVVNGNGNDLIAGGEGIDLVIYSASFAQAQVTRNADKSLTITTSLDGTDTVTGVEQFRFSDGLYSFTFTNPSAAVIANFNVGNGWSSQDQFPRHVADMNGDGYADVVGFGFAGTFVSYGSAAGTFSGATLVLSNFGQTAGWTSDNQFHREVVDVNGDGRADIVGFGYAGTLVSLARSDGSFADPIVGLANFGFNQGWATQDGFARTLGDVNGDGFVDIVGFGFAGTLVSLGNGDGTFQQVQTGLANFGVNQGWSSDNAFHRAVADVTGDGRDDIIGFGIAGTFVAVSKGDGTFDPAQLVLNDFGANQGWSSDDKFSRLLADVNGDDVADIVGFGIAGTLVSFGKGDGTFSDASFDLANFGANQGWNSDNAYHRTIADMNNDGLADIVGFGIAGVLVGLNDGTILL